METLVATPESPSDKKASNRPRVVLNYDQAREIFSMKTNHGFSSSHSASIHLAQKYQISSKAVRDIWKGRSWLEATFDLWNVNDRPPKRRIGRPKGKKDSKPRARNSFPAVNKNAGTKIPTPDEAALTLCALRFHNSSQDCEHGLKINNHDDSEPQLGNVAQHII